MRWEQTRMRALGTWLLSLALLFAVGDAPRVMAAGADGSREALAAVRAALREGSADALSAAMERAVKVGGARVMRALLSQLVRIPPVREIAYWGVLRGIGSFVDRPALEELGEFLEAKRRQPIAKDILYALTRNRSPHVVFALTGVLDNAPDGVRFFAVQRLATVRAPEAVDALIEVLRDETSSSRDEASELALEAAASLSALTGQDYGPNAVNWQGWWDKNRNKPLAGKRALERQTGTAVDYLDRRRKKDFYGVEKAPRRAFVVLSAEFTKKTQRDLNNDRLDRVLEQMGVPHEVVRREDFLDFDLSRTRAILINCAQFHEFCICPDCKPGGDKNNRLYRCTGCNRHIKFSGALTSPQVEKLRRFVLRGGFLFCEDWIVKEFLEKAFPRQLVAGEKLEEAGVNLAPAPGMASHPYLRGIFAPLEEEDLNPLNIDFDPSDDDDSDDDADDSPGRTVVAGPTEPADAELVQVQHRWSIDDESFALDVSDRSRVVTLLSSGDLRRMAKGNGAVAVAFRPGTGPLPGERGGRKGASGVVLAVLSHFGKQGSRADEHSLENLLLNFLIDASVGWSGRSAQAR